MYLENIMRISVRRLDISFRYRQQWGYAVAQLVEALRYKPEGRGFDTRWDRWKFSVNPSGRAMALESTQPLTEMSTRNLSWG
jgi:hypothetical protein